MAKKTFWDAVEIPVYAIILYSIIVLPITANGWLPNYLLTIFGFLVPIAAYAYVGYTVKKDGGETGKAAKYGALAGVIVGLGAAIIGIAAYNFYPQVYDVALDQAVQNLPAGVSRADIEAMMPIQIYGGLIIGPIVHAVMGVISAAIAGAVTKK